MGFLEFLAATASGEGGAAISPERAFRRLTPRRRVARAASPKESGDDGEANGAHEPPALRCSDPERREQIGHRRGHAEVDRDD